MKDIDIHIFIKGEKIERIWNKIKEVAPVVVMAMVVATFLMNYIFK